MVLLVWCLVDKIAEVTKEMELWSSRKKTVFSNNRYVAVAIGTYEAG